MDAVNDHHGAFAAAMKAAFGDRALAVAKRQRDDAIEPQRTSWERIMMALAEDGGSSSR